jgi:hypothetical protein
MDPKYNTVALKNIKTDEPIMKLPDDGSTDTESKEKKWEVTTEALGWIGIILVLTAYGLITFEVIPAGSLLFMGLNLVGAIGIALDAWEDKNIQPVVLNIIWAVIAVVGIAVSLT